MNIVENFKDFEFKKGINSSISVRKNMPTIHLTEYLQFKYHLSLNVKPDINKML